MRREYELELAAFEQDPQQNLRPEEPIYYTFRFFVYCVKNPTTPAQFRATTERLATAANRIAQARADGEFEEPSAEQTTIGPGELTFTASNYARTPMIDPPRRLTSHTARQFMRLDQVRQRQLVDFQELYPEGGTWAMVKMFLGGAPVTIPVDIASLRDALGLPPTDLRLVGQGLKEIAGEESIASGIVNMNDENHDYANDMTEDQL